MLTHLSVAANVAQLKAHTEGRLLGLGPADRVICVLPLFHIYGMVVPFLTSLASRATVVLLPRFDPPSFLNALDSHRVTVGHFVPPIVLFLAKHPLAKQHKFPHLRVICSAAAPLDAHTQQSVAQELGVPVVQGWGMTELSPAATIDNSDRGVMGSAGRLVPGTYGKVRRMCPPGLDVSSHPCRARTGYRHGDAGVATTRAEW